MKAPEIEASDDRGATWSGDYEIDPDELARSFTISPDETSKEVMRLLNGECGYERRFNLLIRMK